MSADDDPPSSPADQRAAALLGAVRLVLRPLVKAMVARGVTLPVLVDALKALYVDVAEREFSLGDKRQTDSRISILTGVHRKDVRSLRGSERGARPRPSSPSISATVVGRWLGDPDFLDRGGAPLVLARSGGAPSFEALVGRVSKDVRPRTILDELVRLGLASHDETSDQVALLADAFVPREGDGDLLHFYKMNLHDHAAAATENLLASPDQPPYLERVVYYSHMTPGAIDQLEARARALTTAALIEINQSALALQSAGDGADQRFRFGSYFYRAPMSDAASSPDLADEKDRAAPDQNTE